MPARIYRPARNAMQSGKRNTQVWLLEFEPADRQTADPVMGWSGSADTRRQVRLKFASQAEAEAYARRQGLDFVVLPDQPRALKLQSYADNFL